MNKTVIKSFYYLFLVTYFLFSACKDDDIAKPVSVTDNFVSNDVGRWLVYDCDSIIHLDNDNNTDNNVDTFHFQLKEVIDSLGYDGEKQQIQHLSRYTRLNDTLPWEFQARWTAKITKTTYQKVEDNIRFQRLAFPVYSSQKWNGNAYNHLGEEDYFYNGINQPENFRTFNFDSTVTVIQGDSTIGYHNYPFGVEKYATGAGLYYKYYAAVDYY